MAKDSIHIEEGQHFDERTSMSKLSSILTALPKVCMNCMVLENSQVFLIFVMSGMLSEDPAGASEASISSRFRFRGIAAEAKGKEELHQAEDAFLTCWPQCKGSSMIAEY